MGLVSGIQDSGSEKPIPDPGSRVKKAQDPETGSATLPPLDNSFPEVHSFSVCLQTTPRRVAGEASSSCGTPLSRTSRLQSCVNLGESPRSTLQEEAGEGEENQDPGFRTPNLCSRPSFR